jgi:spore maturation protein CgeB
MVLSEAVFRAYRPGPPVRTHQELLTVYNSSKLSVNLPQSFISESFQYRLLDVMSSNALLVTRRTPEPDLYRVFGPDCLVAMYDSLAELEAVCAYYLAHEDERAARVAACNALVTEAFSFRSRALDYLRLAGVEFAPPPEPTPRGCLRVLTDKSLA